MIKSRTSPQPSPPKKRRTHTINIKIEGKEEVKNETLESIR